MASCAVCNTKVFSGLEALGKTYHRQCFKCSTCKMQLRDNFKEHEGKLYCATHAPKPRFPGLIKQVNPAPSATNPPPQASSPPVLQDNEKELPWHISLSGTIPANTFVFPAEPSDVSRVVAWYQQNPIPGVEIKSIQVVHNPELTRMFAGRVALLEQRHGKVEFEPRWEKHSQDSSEVERRKEIMDLFVSLSKPHHCARFPHVSLLPLWHGTNSSAIPTILSTGFANLATTDDGYFGKGLYNTTEPEYAYRVYSKGTLLINWVAVASALPVIFEDMEHLTGKGSYQNYDAHFVPVFSPSHPDSIYLPCKLGEKHQYTEIVVFESAQVLPRFIVELQPTLIPNPPINNNNAENIKNPAEWNVEEVCVWLKSLALSKDYSGLLQANNISGSVLLSMTNEDWKEIGITVFGDVRLLTTAVSLGLKRL